MVWANGMPAIAHPDAVVISALIVHIIPDGATPFDFRANMHLHYSQLHREKSKYYSSERFRLNHVKDQIPHQYAYQLTTKN